MLREHADTTPQISEEHGEDWKIFPLRATETNRFFALSLELKRADVLWMMTDPRYWEFLWQIEDVIRPLMPIVYYHVWDNYPTPTFNKRFYDSNDVIVTISNLTKQIVNEVSPDVTTYHVPHSVSTSIYKISENDIARFDSSTSVKSTTARLFSFGTTETQKKTRQHHSFGGSRTSWMKLGTTKPV